MLPVASVNAFNVNTSMPLLQTALNSKLTVLFWRPRVTASAHLSSHLGYYTPYTDNGPNATSKYVAFMLMLLWYITNSSVACYALGCRCALMLT